jgi:hypothetical protein
MLANGIFSGALVLLGVVGYFGTGRASVTALIPTAFGLLVALLSLLAWLIPGWSGAVRFATVSVGVLGFVATARSLSVLYRSLGSEGSVTPATLSKGIMSLSCLAFVGVMLLAGQ